ncbi:MAG: adenylosuccinate lyase [Chloroflexi bacterium]|nr:adenylosuccinate lyase [Chloroflexota bacterium]
MDGHDIYLSPYSWRYGSKEMRHIWSEVYKRRMWRKIWVTLAEVQSEFGLVSVEQVADLREHVDNVDIPRAFALEKQIHHDLMAELKTFAEQSPSGGGALHFGATSADIEDNADVLRTRQAFELIIEKLRGLLLAFVDAVDKWAELPLMAFTHLQPAEPTTLGYRLSIYTQDLFMDWDDLRRVYQSLRGKGFKGAVGTGASYAELIGRDNLTEFETILAMKLELPFYPVTSQVYPRKQDYRVMCALAGLGSSLHKFALDLRILQSPSFGELAEPFGGKQVGSSAMPFKRNPINAEKIDSLARSLAQLPRQAWDNAALSALERTLDDSANRRSMLPEAFLIADELIAVTRRIVDGLVVDESAIERNLSLYGPFAGSERVLMALGKAGADRQVMHERLRELAMKAWASVEKGEGNPLSELISQEPDFLEYLTADKLKELLDASQYLGNAPKWARELSQTIREVLK